MSSIVIIAGSHFVDNHLNNYGGFVYYLPFGFDYPTIYKHEFHNVEQTTCWFSYLLVISKRKAMHCSVL